MEYRDFTPFETVTFDALDKVDNEHHVVVMGGTFDIGPDDVLVLSEDQEPLAATDEYHGRTSQSGVRKESDFAPFKPRTDILLDATAYAPGGKPLPSFTAGVTVNKEPGQPGTVVCEKKLQITGRRYFKPSLLGRWILTDPEPITHLTIRYEEAFGGMVTVYDPETERDRTTFDPRNPIGIGHWPDWTHKEAHRRKRVPVPSIMAPSDIPEFDKDVTPQGFGPICRTWQPRLALAGTYDEAWQTGRWPNLPQDFDFGYWNCAHPDLQPPFLSGGEEIVLQNLTPQGKLRIILPGLTPFVLVRRKNGEIHETKANLDTVFIEPDRKKIKLVWRTTVAAEPEVRVLEARLILRQSRQDLEEADHGEK